MYYIYMLRCQDNSIYTGITTDLERRIEEHKQRKEKCAKYTMRHVFLRLEKAWQTENRSLASKLEYAIKNLNKRQKEELILEKDKMAEFFKEKLETEYYTEIEKKLIKI